MRINALIPVKEAFHVNLLTDLECLDCLVNIRIRSGEI